MHEWLLQRPARHGLKGQGYKDRSLSPPWRLLASMAGPATDFTACLIVSHQNSGGLFYHLQERVLRSICCTVTSYFGLTLRDNLRLSSRFSSSSSCSLRAVERHMRGREGSGGDVGLPWLAGGLSWIVFFR